MDGPSGFFFGWYHNTCVDVWIFSGKKTHLKRSKKKGTNPHHQPTAIDPWMHQPIQGVVAMDVEAFCSTIAEMHDVKEQAIYLAQSLGLDFFLDFLLSWKKTWRFFVWGWSRNHYCWWDRNPGSTHQLRLVVYPIIYRVLCIPSGCLGFLNHQQHLSEFNRDS